MTPCVICQTPSKNKTCSTDQCRRALKNQQQREARAAGIIWGQHPYTCIYCGKQCKSPDRQAKYCSTRCYNLLRYDTIGRVAEEDKAHNKRRRAKAEAIANGTYIQPPRIQREHTRTCTWCSHTFTTTNGSRKRCDQCKDNKTGAQWKILHGNCATCHKPYISRYTTSTCSKDCALTKKRADRNMAKAKRRAVKRKAFVANVYRAQVYARDSYKCHICGHKVDMNATVPHPKAATLDHLTALANGGTHEPLNARTAHFICNSRKRDLQTSYQLLLIA